MLPPFKKNMFTFVPLHLKLPSFNILFKMNLKEMLLSEFLGGVPVYVWLLALLLIIINIILSMIA